MKSFKKDNYTEIFSLITLKFVCYYYPRMSTPYNPTENFQHYSYPLFSQFSALLWFFSVIFSVIFLLCLMVSLQYLNSTQSNQSSYCVILLFSDRCCQGPVSIKNKHRRKVGRPKKTKEVGTRKQVTKRSKEKNVGKPSKVRHSTKNTEPGSKEKERENQSAVNNENCVRDDHEEQQKAFGKTSVSEQKLRELSQGNADRLPLSYHILEEAQEFLKRQAQYQKLPLKLKCRLCNEMLKEEDMKQHVLDNHSNQHTPIPKKHKDKVVKSKMMGDTEPAEAFCNFEIPMLSIHMRQCPICKEYIHEKQMCRHIDSHLYVKRNRFCDICGIFIYKTKYEFQRHIYDHNRKLIKRYKCSKCKRSFSDIPALCRHKRKHMKNYFQCEVCGKHFNNSTQLIDHRAIHMTVKPWQCPECGKGFAKSSNLKTHRRIHSGEKPYACDVCNVAYAHNVSLKMHKKKVHGIDLWKNKPKKV